MTSVSTVMIFEPKVIVATALSLFHSTFAPSDSLTKRNGTKVRSSLIIGATSSLIFLPFNWAVVEPIFNEIFVLFFVAMTVCVFWIHSTSASNSSKIARKGTKVLLLTSSPPPSVTALLCPYTLWVVASTKRPEKFKHYDPK